MTFCLSTFAIDLVASGNKYINRGIRPVARAGGRVPAPLIGNGSLEFSNDASMSRQVDSLERQAFLTFLFEVLGKMKEKNEI